MSDTLKLQLAISKELPDLIEVYNKSDHDNYTESYWHINWKDSYSPVNDREWSWIISECEKKLSGKEKVVYAEKVAQSMGFDDDYYNGWDIGLDGISELILGSTFEIRARAYLKTKGKTE